MVNFLLFCLRPSFSSVRQENLHLRWFCGFFLNLQYTLRRAGWASQDGEAASFVGASLLAKAAAIPTWLQGVCRPWRRSLLAFGGAAVNRLLRSAWENASACFGAASPPSGSKLPRHGGLRLARELPSIPQEFIDQFVKGSMSAEAIQDASIVSLKSHFDDTFRSHVVANDMRG